MQVNVTRTNTSNHDILLEEELGAGVWRSYRVEVQDEKGAEAALTPLGRRQHVWARGDKPPTVEEQAHPDLAMMKSKAWYFPMRTGDPISGVLEVSKPHDLTKPGKYTIQVSRADEQNKTVVKSNVVTVTVVGGSH